MYSFTRLCTIAVLTVFLMAGSEAHAQTRFHIEQRQGKWSVIDPTGSPIFLIGINHLGDGAPRGPARQPYFDEAISRIQAWRMNNLGYGTPAELRVRMPFIAEVQLTTSSQFQPSDAFHYADAFDPAFQSDVVEKVRVLCEETRDSPNLIGYYWSDTPRWDIALARRLRSDDWVSAMRRLPADSPGKKAYVSFLRDRYQGDVPTFIKVYGHAIASFDDLLLFDFREFDRDNPAGRADDQAFLGLIAKELYRVTAEAFRIHAPGRMIFGERYKLHDHPDEVLKEAARWIDVLSIQPGPGVGPRPGPGKDEVDFDQREFERLHRLTGKPILICDHRLSFHSANRPVTLWNQFETQQEAFDATVRFARTAAAQPWIIGYQHCQYRDSFRPDRGNMLKPGLVGENGVPYAEFTSGLAMLNVELTELHFSAPVDRPEDAVRSFRINVQDEVLDDLRERLAKTRWPDQIPGSGWDRGPDMAWMRDLCEYWRTGYDWRKHEARINAWPQFMAQIDGLDVHFIHARSKHEHATPLVLVHGWPGSFVEFLEVLGPLTDPEAHGGKAEDAFHVVVPSLPGFGFSSKPREPGWSSQRMAEVIAKLMARLGYERYGAQGGDWGGGIVRWLAANDPACIGAHSNFPPMGQMDQATDAERARAQQRIAELADHKAYAAIQGTRPLTLGFGLNDSPAGLAAWIVDKFWAWSDHNGKLENSFSKDELLTNITIYWMTETMPSAVRIYQESQHSAPRPSTMTQFEARHSPPAPMGFVLFPKEINVPSRSAVEQSVPNVIHWSEMNRGGHFAAMEQPDELVKDMRIFFTIVRSRISR